MHPEPIVIASAARRWSRWKKLTCPDRWLYLGKSAGQRARAETLLGSKSRLEISSRLHELSRKLRQPFLDLIAEIGRDQMDPIGWWSTRLSWKMWINSDLFLLCVYLHLAEELIEEALQREEPLFIVVEDPWLFRQLKENTAPFRSRVRVASDASLIQEKVRLAASGAARRVWWLSKTLRDLWRQQRVWPRRPKRVPSRPTIAIFSYPQRSCFKEPHLWRDHLLPGMEERLREWGWEVVRFSLPEFSGFEHELAKRSDIFEPLLLWATAGGIWRSFKLFYRPILQPTQTLQRRNVSWLIRREEWMEIGRSALCAFRLFYETVGRLLDQGNWRWVLYSYENQPWEKLLVIAAQKHRVQTAAYQATILSEFYLPYFLGKGEAARMPLPDLIFTSGPYGHRLLQEGGIPPERLRLAGSIRYNHLTQPLPPSASNGSRPQAAPDTVILVGLPIDAPMAEHLLEAVRRSFPDGGEKDGLRFRIRPHPLHPIGPRQMRIPAELVPSDFTNLEEALRGCQGVLFTASSLGLEALAKGIAVLRYRSELLLDVDGVYPEEVPVCSDSDFREKVLTLARGGLAFPSRLAARRASEELFGPFRPETVRQAFGGEEKGMVECLEFSRKE